MDVLVVVALIAASFCGTALIYWAIRKGQRSRDALKSLADQNGWQFAYLPSSGGGASETRIFDRVEGWEVKMYFRSSSSSGNGSSGSSTRWTQFEARDLAIDGMAVLGPDIPEKTKQMADKMMGLMGGDLGLWLLDKLTGGLGEEAQGLRTVDSPGPGTLMTTPGAETALDDLRFAPELENARVGKNQAQQPIVMRGAFGLRIRMAKYLKTTHDVAEFIRLGRELSDNLRD